MLDTRHLLWIGKFAFPQVNTKQTKLMKVSINTYVVRLHGGDIVELRRWMYKSHRRWIVAALGYHEATDTLFIQESPVLVE
jgi:hypothetical protein